MKLQGITLFALFLAKASAAGSGLFAANGFEVEVFVSNGETFIGEPLTLSSKVWWRKTLLRVEQPALVPDVLVTMEAVL
ncbi:uncharacterized protein N7515_000482 [Penicillium bovifimosum]|uniref:Uncharacterized protein n=1 Tax=Penicillium bovifimosum TaxID=126998 RepID=A0A9W9HFU1_9EURO|nr:uncharacterized protein N7515_000482 [Penicillium bovifimosum]KAJ5145918.1 hypothetical protein N7515_000482 [Penicillium bovifimosum]